MPPVAIACAILAPLIWGAQLVVIKVGLAAFPPLFFVSLRFAILSAILLPFVPRPRRDQVWPVVLISIFMGGLNFSLIFMGLGQGQASLAGVAIQLATPFTVLLAWPLLGERPPLRVLLGVVIAFGGVALATVDPGAQVALLPTLMFVGAAFGLAMGGVLTKRYGPFDPFMLVAWMSTLALPQIFVMSLAMETGQIDALRSAPGSAWLALAYTVLLGGIAGFGLWFWLIGRYSMARVAPYGLLQTVFAVITATLFLDEPLTVTLVGGMLLCIAGVAITQRRT